VVQQKQLLQKMEEATTILKTLKEERDAAFTRVSTLEHDNREIQALLTLVEAKVEEMLSTGATSTRTAQTVHPTPAQRRMEPAAAPPSDQPRLEPPVAVAAAQRKAEAPAVAAAQRKVEAPVVSARPEAEAKAPPTEQVHDKNETVAVPQAIEEKTAPRSFTDLKERFRRPFP